MQIPFERDDLPGNTWYSMLDHKECSLRSLIDSIDLEPPLRSFSASIMSSIFTQVLSDSSSALFNVEVNLASRLHADP